MTNHMVEVLSSHRKRNYSFDHLTLKNAAGDFVAKKRHTCFWTYTEPNTCYFGLDPVNSRSTGAMQLPLL